MADTYEQNLSQKGTLTVSDYIRVVGSDNASYKQLVSDVAKKIIENYTGSSLAGSSQSVKSAIDALNSKAKGFNTYSPYSAVSVDWSDCSYTGIGNQIKTIAGSSSDYTSRWVSIRVNNSGTSVAPFGTSSFGVLFNLSSSNYGWVILMSDSPNTSFIVGRLSGGTWTWKDIWGQKMLRYTVTIPSITIGSGGYTSIASYYPGAQSGYAFLMATCYNYGTVTPPSAFSVLGNSNYITGEPNATISNLQIAYIYAPAVEARP